MISICTNCGCSFVGDGDVCPVCFWAAGVAILVERLRNLWYDLTHPSEVMADWREVRA